MHLRGSQLVNDPEDDADMRREEATEARKLTNCRGDYCDSETCVYCLGKPQAMQNLLKLTQ